VLEKLTNISSCVLNNGFTTDLFQVRRGVRQSDPLSPLLFILAIEILATQIRQDDDIHGVMAKNKEIKLTLFADDMTCFSKDMNSDCWKTSINILVSGSPTTKLKSS